MRISLIVAALLAMPLQADDWPQWMGPHRDDLWNETGIMRSFPEGGPKILWRTSLSGGYTGPAVAAGKVYVCDYERKPGEKVVSEMMPSELQGTERVFCLDAKTGKQLWKHKYDCPYKISYPSGPRCTPTVDDDRVYTLGAEGDLLCLNAADGKIIWSKDLKKEYKIAAPMWGFCGHPLVDGNQLIVLVGGDGSVVVSFDKMTGHEKWKALSAKEPGYCPPNIIEAGGTRQLIIWHSAAVCGLDPATGKLYWQIPCAPSYAMSIMAPRRSGDYLFTGGIGNQAVLIKLDKDKPAAELVWKAKKDQAVFPSNSTPVVVGDVLYGCDCTDGAMRAVKIPTGDRLWETFQPVAGKKTLHGTTFLTKNGDYFYLFAETGDLIIAKLSPEKYEEISRAKLLEPTSATFGRNYVWSHPAYANKCIFARNDKEIVCASLAE